MEIYHCDSCNFPADLLSSTTTVDCCMFAKSLKASKKRNHVSTLYCCMKWLVWRAIWKQYGIRWVYWACRRNECCRAVNYNEVPTTFVMVSCLQCGKIVPTLFPVVWKSGFPGSLQAFRSSIVGYCLPRLGIGSLPSATLRRCSLLFDNAFHSKQKYLLLTFD